VQCRCRGGVEGGDFPTFGFPLNLGKVPLLYERKGKREASSRVPAEKKMGERGNYLCVERRGARGEEGEGFTEIVGRIWGR